MEHQKKHDQEEPKNLDQHLKTTNESELVKEKKTWKKMELREFQIAGCLVNAATGS